MGPKLVGGGASLLAAAFILALPSIFKGEPADEVEPIRFGPPQVTELAEAVRVAPDTPAPPEPDLLAPTPVPPASAVPATSSEGEDRKAPLGQGTSVGVPENDESQGGGVEESEGGGAVDGDHDEDGDDELGESVGDDVGGDGDMGESEVGAAGQDDDDDLGGVEDDD